jgi:hypothetical protein
MSYSIYIGNAELEGELDDGEYRASYRVPEVERPDAPAFPNDGMSTRKNGRHPGYTQWSDFCEKAGLHGLFFDRDDGLMRGHPGCFAVTPLHAERMRSMRMDWQLRHPDTAPGFDFSPRLMDQSQDDGVRGRDAVLARLLWLEWWMDWALANCERPAIANH